MKLEPKAVSVTEVRANLARLLDEITEHEPVVITWHGRPAAVLLAIGEYDALGETVEVLSDTDAVAGIEEALVEIERGDTVPLLDVRRELAERHR